MNDTVCCLPLPPPRARILGHEWRERRKEEEADQDNISLNFSQTATFLCLRLILHPCWHRIIFGVYVTFSDNLESYWVFLATISPYRDIVDHLLSSSVMLQRWVYLRSSPSYDHPQGNFRLSCVKIIFENIWALYYGVILDQLWGHIGPVCQYRVTSINQKTSCDILAWTRKFNWGLNMCHILCENI